MEMKIHSWVISISILLLIISGNSEKDDVKHSLVAFLQKLTPSNPQIAQNLNWNASTDPCVDGWSGVTCNNRTKLVRIIKLEGLSLDGSIDAGLLCKPESLTVVSLQNNNLRGNLPQEISNCTQLTHLFLSGNRLSGKLPSSLSLLNNLKRFDISDNEFSDELPEGLSEISGLITFLVQNNKLNGSIPNFDFINLKQFNVSNNLFSGPVPKDGYRFGLNSYLGNLGLCGKLFDSICPPSPIPETPKSPATPKLEEKSMKNVILFSGYIVLGFFLLLFVAYKLLYRKKTSHNKIKNKNKNKNRTSEEEKKESSTSSGQRGNRSEYSITSSNENGGATAASMSLVVLKNSEVKELKFDELLKAPAELLGRGRFGSLYKVTMSDGNVFAVKRIKDWTVSMEEFRRRMERLDQAKHPRVVSADAFYCSKQEKLVVYEYMPNGSLFNLLHGSQGGSTFNWSRRLNMAAGIADAMAFMHRDLHEIGIGHGNLKSSNILLNNNMEPCISEYGLLSMPKQDPQTQSKDSAFKVDIYSFGVILLELLTGKVVQNNGFDLAQWVNSVVREEWTVEVFDKALMNEGVEEGMVRLLQVALKCIDSSVDARPNMKEIAKMIYSLKEDEDGSSIASD